MNKPLVETELSDHVPQCVGFIMDGNRRWAKEQSIPTLAGHSAGKDTFYESIAWVQDLQIPHAVYYAFSTENWLREQTEVSYLTNLFLSFITTLLSEIDTHKAGVRFIGRRSAFSPELQAKMTELEQQSAQYTDTIIWVALSYGGRAEIVSACNQAVQAGIPVDENIFAQYLQTAGMPDPDLIIRTSGEQRLSNFLPWQSVYSELFFTDTYWPAFTKEQFTRIVAQYGDRKRRRGK
jgi:undecaprenyl diphosphate synthase